VRLALRVLVNPPVKAGRTLGPTDGEDGTGVLADAGASGCPRDSILVLDRCSLCGGTERTVVAEFNRFIHFAKPPDEDAIHADLSLCHACGAVYAARRPAGARYRWLFDHFEETLGRTVPGSTREGKVATSSTALSADGREYLRTLAARGAFVSEHLKLSRKEYLPALFADRLAASPHVEILGSLIGLSGRKVLEVRSRLGSIAAALHRLYSADVSTMSIFEGQRFLIHELYGIESSSIDFDTFTVPEGGPWDLIVCNHMLTHAVRPRDFLATLRGRMSPGGYAYFYGESSDDEILVDGKSIFNTMNAFHLQLFDGDALVRTLQANGFQPVFLAHHEGSLLCLAQLADSPVEWQRIDPKDLKARRRSYFEARDAAILMLPESQRWRVADEWPLVIERGVKAGRVTLSPGGKFRLQQDERRA
jgi:2-polyprenyl-3-methyl-5-hydroxy-6-metoxy-1,4-benzoquinol methylase